MGDVIRLPADEMQVRETAMQQAAELRLAACQEALYEEEGAATPSIAPFCGCDTCVVREVLDAAWPHMLALARAEVAREAG